jgi:Tfp pilus assembly protein PilZ
MVVVEEAPSAPCLEGEVFWCTTRDLSAGGLRMVVHSQVPIGTKVRLRVVFTEPPAEFEHLSHVVWSTTKCVDIVHTYSIGLEFSSTDGQSDYKWSDLISAPMLKPELH